MKQFSNEVQITKESLTFEKYLPLDLGYFEACHFQELWCLLFGRKFKCGRKHKIKFDF